MDSFKDILAQVLDDAEGPLLAADHPADWCFGGNEGSVVVAAKHEGVSSRRGGEVREGGDSNSVHKMSSSVLHLDPELYTVDETSFPQLTRPFVRAAIADISVSRTPHPASSPTRPMWLQTISLHADISSLVTSMDEVFGHFPHLTLCSSFWLLPEGELGGPFCVRADALNYHSSIDTHVDLSQEELVVHLWYQLSEEGGKIQDSDCFVPLLLLAPNYGMLGSEETREEHQTAVECVVHNGDSEILFSFTPSYRTALQHATADFCRVYSLMSSLACHRAAHQIAKCIQATRSSPHLPRIQEHPSPRDPFVFLHLEKVGGTSLRE